MRLPHGNSLPNNCLDNLSLLIILKCRIRLIWLQIKGISIRFVMAHHRIIQSGVKKTAILFSKHFCWSISKTVTSVRGLCDRGVQKGVDDTLISYRLRLVQTVLAL